MALDVVTPARLGNGSISVGTTVFYTAPAYGRTILKDIDIANNASTKTNVTVYLVPSSSTPGASNILIPGVEIPANSVLQWTGTQVMNAGDTLVATSTVAGSSLFASGAEVV